MKMTERQRGFSLIELIIVIAVVGIVSIIAFPQYQRYAANTNLKAAARGVAGDIFNARQSAVQTGATADFRLTFDTGANSYSLSRLDTGVTLWTKSVASFGNGIALNSVSFGGNVISFQRRGTATVGHLTLQNNLGSIATITVNITGRTYVQFAMQ